MAAEDRFLATLATQSSEQRLPIELQYAICHSLVQKLRTTLEHHGLLLLLILLRPNRQPYVDDKINHLVEAALPRIQEFKHLRGEMINAVLSAFHVCERVSLAFETYYLDTNIPCQPEVMEFALAAKYRIHVGHLQLNLVTPRPWIHEYYAMDSLRLSFHVCGLLPAISNIDAGDNYPNIHNLIIALCDDRFERWSDGGRSVSHIIGLLVRSLRGLDLKNRRIMSLYRWHSREDEPAWNHTDPTIGFDMEEAQMKGILALITVDSDDWALWV